MRNSHSQILPNFASTLLTQQTRQHKLKPVPSPKSGLIFISRIIIISILLSHATAAFPLHYLDAETAEVSNWSIFDDTPTGATITTVYDSVLQQPVIKLSGNSTKNGFMLGSFIKSQGWNNSTEFSSHWIMRTTGNFNIYVSTMTAFGHRHFAFNDGDKETSLEGGAIRTGLGATAMDGSWKSFSFNLPALLRKAEPDNNILLVNGFLVRGSVDFAHIALSEADTEEQPQISNLDGGTATSSDKTIQPLVSHEYSTCHLLSPVTCRGPHQPVGVPVDVTNKNVHPPNTIDVTTLGISPNTGTDHTVALQQAADRKQPLHLPKGEYQISEPLKIYNSLYGPGTLVSSNTYILLAQRNNITIDGLTIESTTTHGKHAPLALYAQDLDNTSVVNSTLVNARVMIRNNRNAYRKGFVLDNNRFYADLSAFPRNQVENDLITVRGIDGVNISRNHIDVANVNRIVKLADSHGSPHPLTGLGAKISDYNTKNVLIENNIIIAKTDSKKQVVDMFNGAENTTIQNNYIDASGFTSVFENKTGVETSFDQNTMVRSNIIKSDGFAIFFQGSWGATTPNHSSGFQNITVSNNYIEAKENFTFDKAGIGSIRFFHNVDIEHNEIVFDSHQQRTALLISSNQTANIRFNNIDNGVVRLSRATRNSQGGTFNALVKSLNVEGNVLGNANAISLAAFDVQGIGSELSQLIIVDNEVYQLPGSTVSNTIRISDSVFNSGTIERNLSGQIDGATSFSLTGSSISNLSNRDNSWN